MTGHDPSVGLPGVVRQKPVQAGKFVGVLLALALAVAGFFRLVDARGIVGGPTLGDGQFLALVLLPVVGLGLVILVFVETLVGGYRSLRSDRPLGEQVAGRGGYLVVRGVEAGAAVLGVMLMGAAVPTLVAESTPGPAGVGVMLLLFAVGLGILCASLVRSTAELFVYGGAA